MLKDSNKFCIFDTKKLTEYSRLLYKLATHVAIAAVAFISSNEIYDRQFVKYTLHMNFPESLDPNLQTHIQFDKKYLKELQLKKKD